MEIKIQGTEDLQRAAKQFVEEMGDARHFAFHAPMGAGKTTFISALCEVMGAEDEASSPTFSLVNEYAVPGKMPIYHFDFYRIESPAEAMDMGLDDYWDSGALCLMEWPENVEEFLPEDTIDLTIEVLEDGSRLLLTQPRN